MRIIKSEEVAVSNCRPNPMREKLEKQTREFLASGKKINDLDASETAGSVKTKYKYNG